MATEAVKSTPITNLDATPVVVNTAGRGAPGYLQHVEGSAAFTSGPTSGSTYKLARVRTNVKVKSVKIWLDAAVTTFTGDIGIYYSDSTVDGTSTANQGVEVNSSTSLFGSAVALAAVVEPTEYVNEAGNMTGAKRLLELWDAAGLSADPGGYFDLVVTTTATNSGAGVVNGSIEYVP